MPFQSFTKSSRVILFLMFSVILIWSCSDDGDMDSMDMQEIDNCRNSDPSFANDILPILNASCALSGCHVAGFANGDFSTYDDFSSRASRALFRLGEGTMPPAASTGPTPTSDQIQMITCWVEAGAQDN